MMKAAQFLLYLSAKTFVGSAGAKLTKELQAALTANMKVVYLL